MQRLIGYIITIIIIREICIYLYWMCLVCDVCFLMEPIFHFWIIDEWVSFWNKGVLSCNISLCGFLWLLLFGHVHVYILIHLTLSSARQAVITCFLTLLFPVTACGCPTFPSLRIKIKRSVNISSRYRSPPLIPHQSPFAVLCCAHSPSFPLRAMRQLCHLWP